MRARFLFPPVLAACAGAPTERSTRFESHEACEATDPRAVAVTVDAQPDAGEAHLVELLESATESIDLAIYLLGDDHDVWDTLVARAAEIDVRVIVDGEHTRRGVQDDLEDAGAEVRTQPVEFVYRRYGPYYHPKFAVIDGEHAWISTGNLLPPYMSSERNFDVYDDDPQDVADLEELFEADWEDRPVDLDCTRLVVSPINSSDRVLDFIDSAEATLEIESMQLSDRRVRARLAERAAAGVQIRVVLADPCWIDANLDAAAFLAGEGIEARWMGELWAHVKTMVADGEQAWIGSVNMSRGSLDRNREVGVVVSDAAALEVLADTFEHDWEAAGSDWSVFDDLCR